MADQPLVSVYVANHNYGRFIEKAVESALAQTCEDMEIIIIDDGSTDNSREIIQQFVGHPRISVIFQENKGLNVTNNIALRAARGKYIMRLDADDWLDEHAVAVMASALERNDRVGLVFPDYYMADEAGNVQEMVRRHDFNTVTLKDQPAHGACTMIRRDFLLEMGGYDTTYRCQDGYDLWVRFIDRYEVKNINIPLFYYRQHGSSLTRNETRILSTRGQILEKQAKTKGSTLTNVLAVVPVRGKRTDPSSLALTPLGGRALIDWTIDSALAAARVTEVVVTSPDEDVLRHVSSTYDGQVGVHQRDVKLAFLNTLLNDTVRDLLAGRAKSGKPAPDAVMVLLTESPFRGPAYLDKAVHVMEVFDTDAVIGVRPELANLYQHDGGGLKSFRQAATLRLERDEVFREAGQILMTRSTSFEESGQLISGTVGHVVLDQQSAMCITSNFEWELAEIVAAKLARIKSPSDR